VSSLEPLGWSSFFQEQIDSELARLRIARVTDEQRGVYRVAGDFEGWAERSGRFRHASSRAADCPAVGDWVGVAAAEGAERALIHRRLARRSTVSRKAAGRGFEEQVLAANVDTIFLVTIALLGSSGVGKSTLVNRLLGRDLQKVASVSRADGRGRHTTTARQLVALPSGALLIDTPGMRELQPWADESAAEDAFDDVVRLARDCRKRDKSAAAEEQRRWKHVSQSLKELYRERNR
jgi:putative ribosome biogenesis GTPase RsgA